MTRSKEPASRPQRERSYIVHPHFGTAVGASCNPQFIRNIGRVSQIHHPPTDQHHARKMLPWGLHRPVRSWYGSIPEVPLISVAKIYALSHRQHGMRLRAPYVRHPAAKINKVLSRLTCHAAVCTPGSGTASSLRSRRGDTAASAEWNRRFRSQRRPAESRRTKPSSRSASARVLWHTAPLERDTRCSAPRSGGSLRRTRPPSRSRRT